MVSIPRDFDEAARIDGASEWQIFRHVIVPITLAGFSHDRSGGGPGRLERVSDRGYLPPVTQAEARLYRPVCLHHPLWPGIGASSPRRLGDHDPAGYHYLPAIAAAVHRGSHAGRPEGPRPGCGRMRHAGVQEWGRPAPAWCELTVFRDRPDFRRHAASLSPAGGEGKADRLSRGMPGGRCRGRARG